MIQRAAGVTTLFPAAIAENTRNLLYGRASLSFGVSGSSIAEPARRRPPRRRKLSQPQDHQ